MSSFQRVKTSLKKGKDKAGFLTTSMRRSFSPKPPTSEVSESHAVIKHSVDPLQAGQMELLMVTDDKAGAVVASRLGVAESLANVAKGPSNMPIILVPEADPRSVAQASLVPMSSPLTDSVVVSGAVFVMPSEQAALLNAPHPLGQAYLGPFAGSQNVMVINSTFTMADNLLMGQHTPNLVSQKPNSSTLFTGRKEVLKQLKVHFAPYVNRKRQMFLLYGMGGIGKTQICLKFAEEMSDLISKVFWVDASSTDTITLSLKAISGNADGSAPSTLQQIAALEDEWLLVFDNADGGPEVVEKFLPPGNKGNILITSRNLALQRITLVENSLGLPEMTKEDAVMLLQKSSGLVSLFKDQPELAEKIVSELCCLPLAVDQAGAAIHSGLCDVHKYLEHLSKHRQRLMSHPLFRGASQYDRTVYGTFELSYSEIEARATRPNSHVASAAQTAILILQTCAFYHHDNISKDIFKHAAEKSRQQDVEVEIKQGLPLAITSLDYRLLPIDEDGHWDELFFNQGLQMLHSFSLIKRDLSSNVFSMHPLVHYWSQDRMSKLLKQEYCQIGRIILSCAISFGEETDDYRQRQRLLPHINANYQYGTQIGLEQIFRDDEYEKFSVVFGESGDWKKKEALDLELVSKRRDILGLEHPNTLGSMSFLASTYQNQRQWKKAEELQVQVLETIKQVHGLEHPNTLRSMGSLASTYRWQGHLQKAEELLVQVIEQRKKFYGLEDPETLTSIKNLAAVYRDQGYFQKAEELQVQALEKTKKVLGLEHPDTLRSMDNLALTYREQRHLQKAEELVVQVLDQKKKLLGLEHPDTLRTMGNLALIYKEQGHLQRAEELVVQVIEQKKKLPGLEHPDTFTSINNLAGIYRDQGHLQKAEELGVQAFEISKKVLGLEHLLTLTIMSNLALTYCHQECLQKAEELQVQVFETRKKVLGSENLLTLTIMQNLALTYQKQGQLQQAEDLGVQVLEQRKKLLGLEHPDTLTSMGHLAHTFKSQSHNTKAIHLMQETVGLWRKTLGPEHPKSQGSEDTVMKWIAQQK